MFRFLKLVLQEFGKDKIGQQGAAFAYIAVFSLGPLLLVIIAVAGFVFGKQAASGELFRHLSSSIGPDAARTVQNAVQHTHTAGGGVVAILIGAVGLLLGAAGITSQLQNTFDSIFSIVPDPKGGLKRTAYIKLKNSFLVVAGGVIIAASVVISTLIAGVGHQTQSALHFPPSLLEILNTLVSLALFVLMLFLVYRAVPGVKIPTGILLRTSLAVAVLFIIGKFILGVVIGHNGTASAYGAAASLITLLLWIYYSGQILFLGAEGVKVYGQEHNLVFKPKKFNLKRQTLTLDSGDPLGRFMEAALNGYRKRRR